MARESRLTGVVVPDVDDRAMEQNVQRPMERALDRASNITPDLNMRGVGQRLSRLVPGGGLLADAIGGGGRGGQTVGGLGETDIQAAQLAKLEDIHDEIRKGNISEAQSGGGGGGGVGGSLLAGFGLRSLIGGGSGGLLSALGIGTTAGGAAGITAGAGALAGLRDRISRRAPETGMGLFPISPGSPALLGMSSIRQQLGIERPRSFEDLPSPPDLGLGNIQMPDLPDLSSMEWPELPGLNSLEWPELPRLDALAWPELPSLSQNVQWPDPPDISPEIEEPGWVQDLVNAIETIGGEGDGGFDPDVNPIQPGNQDINVDVQVPNVDTSKLEQDIKNWVRNEFTGGL